MSTNADTMVVVLQALAAGDVAALERHVSPDFVFHSQREGKPAGAPSWHDRALLLSSALYDARLEIELVVEDGDLVVSRWRGRAVHKGDFAGVPPTGRPVDVGGITILRFAAGLVVEEWTEFDGLGLLEQIAPGWRGALTRPP